MRAIEVLRGPNIKEVPFAAKCCRADLEKERSEDVCFEREARGQVCVPKKTLLDGIEAAVNPTWTGATLFKKTTDDVILDKNATLARGVVDANYGHRKSTSRRSVEPGERRRIHFKISVTVHNQD